MSAPSPPPQTRDAPAVIPPPGEDLTIEKNWPCQPKRESDEQFMLRMRLYRPWSLQPDDIVPNWPQIAMGMSATTFAAVRMTAAQPTPRPEPIPPANPPGPPEAPEPVQHQLRQEQEREAQQKLEREQQQQREEEERRRRGGRGR